MEQLAVLFWEEDRRFLCVVQHLTDGQLQIFIPLKSTKSGKLELLTWLFPKVSCLQT